jgi:RHS repeat-associated protein
MLAEGASPEQIDEVTQPVNRGYRYQYQGQFAEKDEETGWNHFELREYDPIIARWLSFDPYRVHPSPYVAMRNNPVNSVDADGGCPDGCPEQAQLMLDENNSAYYLLPEFVASSADAELAELISGGVAQERVNYRDRAGAFFMGYPNFVTNQGIQRGFENFARPRMAPGNIEMVNVELDIALAITTGPIGSTVESGGGFVLRHYTTEAGYKAIMESGELLASVGVKNARHGAGQYFTDIMTAEMTWGQVSHRLFGVPWNYRKLTHFVDVNMTGLNVIKNAPHNFLVPGTGSLSIQGRVINHGLSVFKPKL